MQPIEGSVMPPSASTPSLTSDPGGHFFGTPQTMERFETAFYAPMLSDWRNYETWSEDGSKTAYQRANTKLYKQLLAEYEEPAIDPATKDADQRFRRPSHRRRRFLRRRLNESLSPMRRKLSRLLSRFPASSTRTVRSAYGRSSPRLFSNTKGEIMPSQSAPSSAGSDPEPSSSRPRKPRSGGRAARAAQAKQALASAGSAYAKPRRNTVGGLNIVSDEALEQIHEASIHILENFGVEFMAQDARDTFVHAGALADDETGRVRVGRELIDAALATCPSYFELTPRNPDRRMRLGENFMNFTLVAGPPSVHDEINGRRSGGMTDYVDLVKLAQSFDVIHAVGNQPVAPMELPANTRHLDTYFANLRYTDLSFHASAIGEERALDAIDMMAISRGMTREQLKTDPSLATVISVNSPAQRSTAP